MTPRRPTATNRVPDQPAPPSPAAMGDGERCAKHPPEHSAGSSPVCSYDGATGTPPTASSPLLGSSSPLTSPTASPPPSPSPSPSFSRASEPHLSLFRRVRMELREQLRTSVPAILGMVLYKIPWLLSLGFVGRIGPMELAAAALASALCDVTGMSLSYGLSSALTTLTGQARGDLLAMAEDARKLEEFKRRLLERARDSERGREQKRLRGDDGGRRAGGGEKDNLNDGGCDVGDADADGKGASAAAAKQAQFRAVSEGGGYSAVTLRSGVADRERASQLRPSTDDAALEAPGVTPRDTYGAVAVIVADDRADRDGVANGGGDCILFDYARRSSTEYQSFQSSATADSDLDEPPLLPMVYLYRGMFIQLCLVIPVGIWWLRGVYPLLIALGQPDDLSVMTQTYLRILTPGLWSYSVNWTLTAWLQAIEMADIPPYAALVGGLLHVPFNLFFIHVCGWGYLGVAAATVMFQVVQPSLMFLYLFATRRGRDRLLEQLGATGVGRTDLSFASEVYAAVSSAWGIYQYLGLAVPGIIVISEWWASEVVIFLSGRLQPDPEFALSGMAIYQTINSSCFMLPVGISVGGSTRVGNLLGARDSAGAELASNVCIGSAAILSCAMGSVLYFTPHSLFPSLFSPESEDVIEEASETMMLLSIYVFADGIQVALNGIIKGCGRQCITVPIVLTAYWIIGVPLAYYLSFIRNGGEMCQDDYFCGIVGLVGGMTAGTWMHLILLWITIKCTTDWDREAKKAHDRLALEAKRRGNIRVDGDRGGAEGIVEAGKIEHEIRILHRRKYPRLDEDASIASITTM